MTGTAKQVAWAEDIKAAALRNVQDNLNSGIEMFREFNHPTYAAKANAYGVMQAVLTMILSSHDDAEYIIRHRHMLALDTIRMTVSRWTELIESGRKTPAQIAKENGVADYQEVL